MAHDIDIDPERQALIQRAFNRLSRLHQTLFFLARHEERSYPEIAHMLGISEKQVERQIAKALFEFSRAIDREEHPRQRRWWLCFPFGRR